MRARVGSVMMVAVLALLLAACGEDTVTEVITTVEVVKEVVVEVEKITEVEVERIVTVEKIVIATPTAMAAGGPKFGGTLRIVSHGSVSTLHPVFSLFAVVNYVSSQFYEQLFGWDGNLDTKERWWTPGPLARTAYIHLQPQARGQVPRWRPLHVRRRGRIDYPLARRRDSDRRHRKAVHGGRCLRRRPTTGRSPGP